MSTASPVKKTPVPLTVGLDWKSILPYTFGWAKYTPPVKSNVREWAPEELWALFWPSPSTAAPEWFVWTVAQRPPII